MANASIIKHITITVPATMTEEQAGLTTSALAHFMNKNPQTVVSLRWRRTNKHTAARTPRAFSPTIRIAFSDTAETMSQVPSAYRSINDLGDHMTGKTTIPATSLVKGQPEALASQTAQAHRNAFTLMSTFRKTQISSALGYV